MGSILLLITLVKIMFFFVSDLKIVYYNNYEPLITMPWTREETFLVSTVFANGPGERGSISGRVIPKILKMVPDTS